MRSHKSLWASTKHYLFSFSPSGKRQHPLKAMRSKRAELKKNCNSTKARGGDKFCMQKAHALKRVPKLIPATGVPAGSDAWAGPSRIPREQHPRTSGASCSCQILPSPRELRAQPFRSAVRERVGQTSAWRCFPVRGRADGSGPSIMGIPREPSVPAAFHQGARKALQP